MFCISCGTELPNNANFCFKCGKPQKNAGTLRQATETQERWEIKEFSEPISGNKRIREDKWDLSSSVVRDPIDAAVRSLLERLAPLGWEPAEPIEVGRLVLAHRVIIKTHAGFPIGVNFELIQVLINFRRRVT